MATPATHTKGSTMFRYNSKVYVKFPDGTLLPARIAPKWLHQRRNLSDGSYMVFYVRAEGHPGWGHAVCIADTDLLPRPLPPKRSPIGAAIGAALAAVAESRDPACTRCGASTADLEGYDGLCGHCADWLASE